MSRVVGQMTVLYGSDYCAYALQSIAPFVDQLFVFLALGPSHGTQSALVCPDSPEQMRAAIQGAGLGDKLRLIEGRWNSEGEHRAEILKYVEPSDLIVVVDADEIWVPEQLQQNIAFMRENNFERMKVRMVSLWRSFEWYCTDPMTQDRLIKVGGEGVCYAPFSALPERPDIFHAGYCRKPDDIRYKLSIHGHISTIFPNWFEEKFLAWHPGNGVTDCHPDCADFWHPKPFNRELLPALLHSHPFFPLVMVE